MSRQRTNEQSFKPFKQAAPLSHSVMRTVIATCAWDRRYSGQAGENQLREATVLAETWSASQEGRVLRSRKFRCINTPNALTRVLPFELIIPILMMIDPTIMAFAALRLVCKAFKILAPKVGFVAAFVPSFSALFVTCSFSDEPPHRRFSSFIHLR